MVPLRGDQLPTPPACRNRGCIVSAITLREGPIMNPNKALWEKGDFTQIAAFMRQSGEAVVKSLGLTPPLRALDLGCGDGTTAIPLAQSGAEVVGIDIAKNLVEAGKKRSAAEGLNRLTFQEGDACDLQGVASRSFDLTLSIFGAMFAPKPFDVAREMVRVTRPGGRIVMGNWIPNDATSFVSQLQGENNHGQGHLFLYIARQKPGTIRRNIGTMLRPDHERLRGRSKKRNDGTVPQPGLGIGASAKQGHRWHHLNTCHLPAGDCFPLSRPA